MFIIIFSDSLSWPAVPYLIRETLLEETAVVTMLGLLISTFNLIKIAANILGAFLGDRVNRDVIVLLALILLPASFALLLFAANYLWILGSYILFGIFYGILMPPLNAMVADSIPRKFKGTLFGVFNLSWILSQIPAPIIGGLLSKTISLRFPLTLSLTLSLITLASFIALRKTLEGISSPYRQAPAHGIKGPAKIPTRNLLLLCLTQFFFGLGSGALAPIITAFLIYVIGASPAEMGLAYSLGWGLATAIAQIPGGKLSDKLGYKPVIIASTLVGSPLILLLPFSKNLMHFISVSALSNIFGYLALPAFSAYTATLVGEGGLSRGFGLTSASFSIGSIAGPIIGSFLWTISEPNYFPPFAVSTISLLLMLPFIIALRDD
ncbi:MAG: MFS transporter [Candidatus Bathyarchaeia archaeon]